MSGIASPTCFLHVPKSGGVSVQSALESALPPGALAPYRADRVGLFTESTEPDRLDPVIRRQVVLDRQDITSLAGYRAVSGHFALSTLLQVTPAHRIATVLREPRARLISLYAYFRLPATRSFWEPIGSPLLREVMRPFEAFLTSRDCAAATDNQLCRLLLAGDPRIPERDFIAPEHVAGLASAASEQLDRLGFVGILESGDHMWEGLSRLFGIELERRKVNTSSPEVAPDGAGPPIPTDPNLISDALDRRTAADAIVYESSLRATSGEAGGAWP